MKYIISLNGKDYEVLVERGEARVLNISDTAVASQVLPTANSTPVTQVSSSGANDIKAPFSGLIVKSLVSDNQAVKKGDVLMILEAMKMENEITAPADGTVLKILVSNGQNVNTGDALIAFS